MYRPSKIYPTRETVPLKIEWTPALDTAIPVQGTGTRRGGAALPYAISSCRRERLLPQDLRQHSTTATPTAARPLRNLLQPAAANSATAAAADTETVFSVGGDRVPG
jgi:hypothetical protein